MDHQILSFVEYRLLVEQAPILIWRANRQGKCDYFNQRWLSFTGRTMEQELGDGWAQGVHPNDLDKCLETYLNSFERRETFEMTYRLRRHDGEYRWIFDSGSPYFDDQNQFAGYIGSCHDVTAQVEGQQAKAEAQESQVRQLMGLLPICASCKRIRDKNGDWRQLEEYIEAHTRAAFSHGLCRDCAKRLYPEFLGDDQASDKG